MGHSAPEEVVVLLVGDPGLEVKAVWLHAVLALLPLHSLALRLGPHLACGLGPGLAAPLDGGDLLLVVDHLVIADGGAGLTVVGLNLLSDHLVHQLAVLPGHVPAVLIPCPDLLSIGIHLPLGVALLLGDIVTLG